MRNNHQPASTAQRIFPIRPKPPVPMSDFPVTSSLETTNEPKGKKLRTPILNAARAQGSPTIVTAKIKLARNQLIATWSPPKINQSKFRTCFICNPPSTCWGLAIKNISIFLNCKIQFFNPIH